MSLRKRPKSAPLAPLPAKKATTLTSLAGPIVVLTLGLGGLLAWSVGDYTHENTMGLLILSVATLGFGGYQCVNALGVDLSSGDDTVAFDGDGD